MTLLSKLSVGESNLLIQLHSFTKVLFEYFWKMQSLETPKIKEKQEQLLSKGIYEKNIFPKFIINIGKAVLVTTILLRRYLRNFLKFARFSLNPFRKEVKTLLECWLENRTNIFVKVIDTVAIIAYSFVYCDLHGDDNLNLDDAICLFINWFQEELSEDFFNSGGWNKLDEFSRQLYTGVIFYFEEKFHDYLLNNELVYDENLINVLRMSPIMFPVPLDMLPSDIITLYKNKSLCNRFVYLRLKSEINSSLLSNIYHFVAETKLRFPLSKNSQNKPSSHEELGSSEEPFCPKTDGLLYNDLKKETEFDILPENSVLLEISDENSDKPPEELKILEQNLQMNLVIKKNNSNFENNFSGESQFSAINTETEAIDEKDVTSEKSFSSLSANLNNNEDLGTSKEPFYPKTEMLVYNDLIKEKQFDTFPKNSVSQEISDENSGKPPEEIKILEQNLQMNSVIENNNSNFENNFLGESQFSAIIKEEEAIDEKDLTSEKSFYSFSDNLNNDLQIKDFIPLSDDKITEDSIVRDLNSFEIAQSYDEISISKNMLTEQPSDERLSYSTEQLSSKNEELKWTSASKEQPFDVSVTSNLLSDFSYESPDKLLPEINITIETNFQICQSKEEENINLKNNLLEQIQSDNEIGEESKINCNNFTPIKVQFSRLSTYMKYDLHIVDVFPVSEGEITRDSIKEDLVSFGILQNLEKCTETPVSPVECQLSNIKQEYITRDSEISGDALNSDINCETRPTEPFEHVQSSDISLSLANNSNIKFSENSLGSKMQNIYPTIMPSELRNGKNPFEEPNLNTLQLDSSTLNATDKFATMQNTAALEIAENSFEQECIPRDLELSGNSLNTDASHDQIPLKPIKHRQNLDISLNLENISNINFPENSNDPKIQIIEAFIKPAELSSERTFDQFSNNLQFGSYIFNPNPVFETLMRRFDVRRSKDNTSNKYYLISNCYSNSIENMVQRIYDGHFENDIEIKYFSDIFKKNLLYDRPMWDKFELMICDYTCVFIGEENETQQKKYDTLHELPNESKLTENNSAVLQNEYLESDEKTSKSKKKRQRKKNLTD